MTSMKKASQALSIATFCLVLLSTTNLGQLQSMKNSLAKSSLGSLGSVKTFAECGDAYGSILCDPINNTANVSANTTDPLPLNNTANVTDTVCLTSDAAVAITAPTPTTQIAGTSITYTTTFTNNGPSVIDKANFSFGYNSGILSNLVVASAYPNFNFNNSTTSGTGASTTLTGLIASNTGGTANAGLNLLVGQSMTITITADVNSTYTGALVPTFTMLPIGPSTCPAQDTATANNTTTFNTTVTGSADMSIVKVSSGGSDSSTNTTGTLNQNTNVTYTLTATNNGPSTAAAPISITDTYDSAKLLYVSSTTPTGWTCGTPNLTIPAAATVTCVTTTLPMANADVVGISHIFTVK
jgi:large repetitive protein